MTDDHTLVDRAQHGDRRALEELLRRHYDRVHAICRRVIGAGDVDDAAQEAMISIVRGLPRFDGRAAFTTWLYRIATNAALDELRKRRRRPALRLVDESGRITDDPDPLAHRLVESSGDRLDIDAAMASIPVEFRAAVTLRDVCDLDYAEIAEALDIPVGTVKSRIARGRSLLAGSLGSGNQTDTDERPTSTPQDPAP